MNSPGAVRIQLDRIEVGERLRVVDRDYAHWVAVSMKEIGQMTPIEVRQVGHANKHQFRLVAGAHRLEGARINGWKDIEAKVVKVNDLEAELREIDENLFRRNLNALDRSTALARRQEVYLELHPETARGKAGAEARWMQWTELSFADVTAEKLGVSGRDVRRSIARHTKIVPDVRAKIAGTWIADRGIELDALARLGPDRQRQAVKLMLQEAHPAASVAAAVRALDGDVAPVKDEADLQLERLMAAWRKAGAKARRRFVAFLDKEGALAAPKAAA